MRLPFSTGGRAYARTGEPPVPPVGPAVRRSLRRFRLRLGRRLWFFLALLVLTAGVFIVARPHVRAWHHRREARAELQRYHTPQAVRHLLICRAIWPRDPETLLLAARAARRAKLYGGSERLLRDYRQVRGRDEACTFEHLLLTAECRVEEVADSCWRCVEEGRFDAALLLEALTRGYLQQYKLGQARHCLQRWRQIQPDNPQIFYLEGLFNLDYVHDRSAAEESYGRALELDPDHEEARLGLAFVLLLGGKNFAQAAEHFKHLRQCQPDNYRVQVSLAECLDGLGESAEAVRMVDEVLAWQPECAAALSLRGQFALQSGQLDEAESWLRRALHRDPMDHRARHSLVLCLGQSGQQEEAQRQRRRLEQIDEDLRHFHEIVTKEIAKRPRDPVLHCTLGQILLRSGQPAEGVRWLQSALRLDPHYAPALQSLEEHQEKAKSEPRP
jgi:tetratricopeptide (TPR) repeat protein